MREIDEFEEIADQYLALVEACVANPLLGRTKCQQLDVARWRGIERVRGKYYPGFSALLQEYGLLDYFERKGLALTLKGAARGLSRINLCAKLLIHAYSGMRYGEARNLPYHCLKQHTPEGSPPHSW